MTKKEIWGAIALIPEVQENEDLLKAVQKEIDRLNRKPKTGKAKEKEEYRQYIADTVLQSMEEGRLYRPTELINSVDALTGISTQALTPVLIKLVESGQLEKLTEKRINYYRLRS